jgi:alpha-tubulin suppressor-like RCC1 family protein
MAVDSQGRVFVCGDNSFRQLGISNTDKVADLVHVQDFSSKAKNVAAGI